MSEDGGLRLLLERAAILDLHARYFQGLDSGREAQVRGCFLPDVRAIYHNRPVAVGLEALMADSLTPFFQRLATRHTRIATHFMGNVVFERIEGEEAETEVYAIAFGVRARAVRDQVAMMSLRYMDKLRRTEAGWRIAERVQSMDWGCHVPASTAMEMMARVNSPQPSLR